MPALGGITGTPSNILMGPGNIWLDVTAPLSGTALTLTSGAPTTGTNIGLTMGPAELSFRSSPAEFNVEQALSPVDFAQSAEECTLSFEVAEVVGYTLQKFFQGSTPVGAGATQWIYGGGKIQPASQVVLLVSPRRDNAAKFTYALLYKAFVADVVTLPVSQTKPTSFKVRFKGMADITRAVGDHLYQFHPNL